MRLVFPNQKHHLLLHSGLTVVLFFCFLSSAVQAKLMLPLPLLILGVLRVLGWSHTFDDLAENTNISQETCRVFFHAFTKRWSLTKYPELVKSPQTRAEYEEHSREYALAGFDGCVGSIDCVHVAWWRTPATLQNVCTGKEGYASNQFRLCFIAVFILP
jgi:hypothetical protein